MRTRFVLLLTISVLIISFPVSAETDLFKRFKTCYGGMGSDLAGNPPAELAEITDFVYQKDLATFTFQEGRIYLLRKMEGRPITAIFIGQGHAHIEIPSHVEKRSLEYASGDSLVDKTFEVAFIDFSDDFDLKLKEKFEFEKTSLPWRDFNRSQQGEFFFKPVITHRYDNYFQLLRSLFERKEDGFFWIDFDRYVFSFDPNRPEEVVVAYEHEGGDTEVTDGAVLQRQERNIYGDYESSNIGFPTTILSRGGELRMVGLDGKNLDRAAIDFKLMVNADSLRFVSLFLHYRLKVDSVYCNGAPIEFWRRGSFTFMGLILPEYSHQGDTLDVQLFYHGTKYHQTMPFVDNPTPSPHNLTFDIYKDYNYIAPAMVPAESSERGRAKFTSAPSEPYRMYMFWPYAAGFDTVNIVSNIGLTLSYITSKHIDKNHFECFLPFEQYEPTVTSVFDFMSSRLGPPLATFAVSVFPEPTPSIPSLIGVSQTDCHVDGTGGLVMAAGEAIARQYFGALMRPATDREYWLMDALPDYLSLMAVWHEISPAVFFGELGRRRNHIYGLLDINEDRPLATGRRLDPVDRISKGAWVMHMLRFMMYDLEGQGNRDKIFWRFINELKLVVNNSLYTNEDFIRLAEKHCGGSLDWFFHHWLYDRNIPEYKIKYQIVERDDGHYIAADIETKKVGADFKMPVIMRVVSEGGRSVYLRQMLEAGQSSFELGPFTFTPKELVFNEFHSVLCKDKVKKK
ncbi:MAG: hypothetical protein J7J98_10020 [candidate division Zixibacteria bacterium]|nr:hypothetical protein [candidate division Zixibacteria bacterium]